MHREKSHYKQRRIGHTIPESCFCFISQKVHNIHNILSIFHRMARYLNNCRDNLDLHTLFFKRKCLFSIISSNSCVQMIFYLSKKWKSHSESDIWKMQESTNNNGLRDAPSLYNFVKTTETITQNPYFMKKVLKKYTFEYVLQQQKKTDIQGTRYLPLTSWKWDLHNTKAMIAKHTVKVSSWNTKRYDTVTQVWGKSTPWSNRR